MGEIKFKISPCTEGLNDTWYSKMIEANEKNIVKFIFSFEDNFYLSEWNKYGWSLPVKIDLL